MQARKATVLVNYAGVNITQEISKDMLGFSYTDNASEEADNVNLTLKDEYKKWSTSWFPEKGDTITPVIKTTNWRWDGDSQKLPCGGFYVDEPEYSGRPRQLSLGAVSAPLNSNFKETKRSQTWRNITLQEIASKIAKRYGLQLETYLEGNNPGYSSLEQTETPDASFLSDLCEEEALAMKVTDKKIIIFDESVFEQRAAVATVNESSSIVKSYSFRSSLSNTAYAGVNIKYYDANMGRNIEFLYQVRDGDKIFELNSRVSNGQQAKRLARRKLRQLNKREYTGSLSLYGNVNIVGGACIILEGFGVFDGKYYVQSATHSIGSGYTTDVDIRKVLEGY